MKGNGLFYIGIIIILLLGVGGYVYKEGYISFTSKDNSTETKSNQAAEKDKNKTLSIADITKDSINQQVSIKGEITSRFDHKNGHVFLTIKDSTGSIKVPIFKDKNIDTKDFEKGTTVQVSGNVEEYEGELEIIPESSKDIKIVNLEDEVPLITEKQQGQRVDVKAKILSKYTHPEGHIFLNIQLENKQELSLPIFSSLNANSDDYPTNSIIQVQGKVDVYNNKLEIVPDDLNSIQILTKGDESKIKELKISDITEKDRGKMTIVEGYVKDIQARNDGHLMFKLEQNGSSIKTVLFRADSDEIQGRRDRIKHAEKAQFPVRVIAMVDVYDGELELIIDKVLVD